MNENLWLILHKVDGQPALDVGHILEKTEPDSEEIWIVSTSGHRAYPHKTWRLADWDFVHDAGIEKAMIEPLPPDLPEHYRTKSAATEKQTFDIGSILKDLIPTRKFLRRA